MALMFERTSELAFVENIGAESMRCPKSAVTMRNEELLLRYVVSFVLTRAFELPGPAATISVLCIKYFPYLKEKTGIAGCKWHFPLVRVAHFMYNDKCTERAGRGKN